MSIQAIIFDFGAVLSFEWRTRKMMAEHDRALGLPRDTLFSHFFSGNTWELVSTGKVTVDEYFRRLQATWEGPWPAGLEEFRHGGAPADGINGRVVRLAAALRRRYKVGLLSNATVSLRGLLSELGLLELFDFTVISAEAGLRKPDPAIFRLTAIVAELDVAECLLIDDKARNTLAAEAVGMQAIQFRSAAQTQRELIQRGILEKPVF
jgi:HAD superfamily hydrolase (TIGR01509 family)